MSIDPSNLAPELIADLTYRKTVEIGLQHAAENLPYVSQTIADLGPASPRPSAIVIAAGPSLHRRESAARILRTGYRGTVIATDGALGYCLRHGLVPDYVVSLDPHPTRIVRWFGDSELEHRAPDDYFRRQDLDPHLATDEIRRNGELLRLVDAYATRIRAILATSVAPAVTRRVASAGMAMYWWNPIYDDFDDARSVTRRVFELNKVPCMVTGGNCGSAAWVFATAVLQCRNVAVVGMDLSYAPGTPLTSTQYYSELRELFGERMAEAYIHVENQYLGETWFADPTYWWYRQSFLELAEQSVATTTTYNCTEGGILFGGKVQWLSLDDFLSGPGSTGAGT